MTILQCTIAGGRTKELMRNLLFSSTNMAAMTYPENHLEAGSARWMAVCLMHDYQRLYCFTGKPRFQRVIPCRIKTVNSQSSANQKNSYRKYVKAFTS